MSLSYDPRLKLVARELCRKLRASQTPAEKIFWEAVRNRKFKGLKFYRQYPIFFDYIGKETFYIADFFCFEKKTVIEIDGQIHEYLRKSDKMRTFIMNMLGIEVLRFRNDEIIEDIDAVLDKLRSKLGK